MNTLALVWSDKPLASLTYTTTPTFVNAGECKEFNPAEYTTAEIETTIVAGITISGRRHKKIKHVHRNYNIVISSDEFDEYVQGGVNVGNLGEAGIDFFRQLWTAPYIYISVELATGTMSAFRQVDNDGGVIPLDFIDKIIMYPEITLKLKEVKPLKRQTNGKYNF